MRAWRVMFAALVLVIAWLAFSPKPPDIGTGWDKTNHLAAFAALAFVGALASTWRWRLAGGLLAYGGFIELVQARIPGRSGEWNDLLADALGISLGLLMSAALAWAAQRRTNRPARR
ncbi:MAG: VanZ family protein [Rubrivivax sp.]|nr:VanZ family protein [Rubrivivax sp.]